MPAKGAFDEDSMSKLANEFTSLKKVRMIGSAAMAACYIASGKAERYQENGIFLWDIIAGAAIVESAGGSAEIFNQRDNFQVDVIFSNSKVK